MTKEKKEEEALVVVDERGELVPAHIKEGQQGLENIGPGDLMVPRLLIMQALSPQVKEGLAHSGEALNNLTNEVWIPRGEVTRFIPVFHYKEWIQWAPRSTSGGMIDRSLDPASPLAMMATRREKDAEGNFISTEYHNFISVFIEHGVIKPVIIPCAKSNHKHGGRLLGLAKYRGNYPLYAGVYSIGVVEERNRKNQPYFVWNFENDGWVDAVMLPQVKSLYDMMRKMQFKAAEPPPPMEGTEI